MEALEIERDLLDYWQAVSWNQVDIEIEQTHCMCISLFSCASLPTIHKDLRLRRLNVDFLLLPV